MSFDGNKTAVLLAALFLLAQFHFCADLSAASNSTHFCPFCSTAATAIAAQAPIVEVAPVATRLEFAAPQLEIATIVALSISPRAPPAP